MTETLSVEIMLFARAVELAGCRTLMLRVAPGASIGQLRDALIEQYPALAALTGISRWAVNSEFVEVDYQILNPTRIAMIPPVSGG